MPAWAHCVAVRTSSDSGPTARTVSSHGATPEKTDSDATAAHAIGSAKFATIAGAEASRIAPSATPVTIPETR